MQPKLITDSFIDIPKLTNWLYSRPSILLKQHLLLADLDEDYQWQLFFYLRCSPQQD